MVSMMVDIAGGLGLFLLGMTLLTDGLKSLAGSALREILSRFVKGTVSSVVTGAVFTAAVQSSSATTLTTIGFVSAGLITFTQGVGVIMGANVGTTSTGWIVSLLGLKVSIGSLSPVLIFVGVMLRLLTRDRWASFGFCLAGFGLVFLGISVLQTGMAGLQSHVNLDGLPEGLIGKALLVGVGIVMTVIMQSSSAAMAATLVAVSAGAIEFPQAAVLVIGQNIGTTVTAALACIGASLPARRTAVAHIMFNIITGGLAFALLPVLTWASLRIGSAFGDGSDAISLAVFHTLFNIIGVVILIPFIGAFSRLVTRITPGRVISLTRRLDPTVATLSAVGLEAARRTGVECLGEAAAALRSDPKPRKTDVEGAVRELAAFIGKLSGGQQTGGESESLVHLVHATNHLKRLLELRSSPGWRSAPGECAAILDDALVRTIEWSQDGGEAPDLADAAAELSTLRAKARGETLTSIAAGRVTPEAGARTIDAVRWMDKVLRHTARSVHHLGNVPDVEGEID